MNQQIIVNMSVKDLGKSKAFFSALGYTFNQAFSNEQAALLVIAENSINAMLMTESFFKSFHSKQITNAREAIEMWVCLTCESREEVDSLMTKAVSAGATALGEPEDYGFMYAQGFEDLDGHSWQLHYMSGLPG
ncbi:MAG: glyoxalase/bleomycin resistance/extradiol dioxygenase family protein [Bdellovibrionales bacterium]|nr:glyoxalase/bleomycin resistance/extradiol dioxygenase family protein [Massilia sp.]